MKRGYEIPVFERFVDDGVWNKYAEKRKTKQKCENKKKKKKSKIMNKRD